MKKYLLIFMFALLTIQIAQAQEATPSADDARFTFTTEGPDQLFYQDTGWMPDSQSFFFHFLPLEPPPLPMLQYFVQHNELRNILVLPTETVLPGEQATAFSSDFTLASRSPNGRYVVYRTNQQLCGVEGDCSLLLGLGDLVTGRHITLRKGIDQGHFVRWSADSSAFLIVDYGLYGGLGGILYVNVASALAATADYTARMLMNFGLGEPSFVDISRDGRRVLVRDQGNGLGTGRGLFLWDSRTPDTGDQFAAFADGRDVLKDDIVTAASFIPGDDQHLLVVVREGLARYDLKTGQLEVLNPAINSQWVVWAYFSPDVRYVLTYAQVENGSDWQAQIALYPVEP
jgi:hypothetical protein